ncbi:MAG TPA: SpoIIE family protein phosphatase [Terriglobales bacterium]|nr:SpoIIE family protein phosphatase [Terriglobales bacterium]
MRPFFHDLRFRLIDAGVWPTTRLAYTAWYLLGLDVLLFLLQQLLMAFNPSFGRGLSGWISFLSFIVIVLFAVLALRLVKAKLLWRLRNRLIVTYVFIGVIPVMLLVGMTFITLYLFAGQFANFVVTSDLNSRLHSLQAVNTAIAHELSMRLAKGEPATARSLEGLRRQDRVWARRQTFAWQGGKPLLLGGATETAPFVLPSSLGPQFGAIVSDRGQLYLRTAFTVDGSPNLTLVSSEALDAELLEKAAAGLGEVTLLAMTPNPGGSATTTGQQGLRPVFTVGNLPPAQGQLDRVIGFPTPLPVVDWTTGQPARIGALFVQTRPSALYSRLFATLGDFVQFVEDALLAAAVVFGIIEVLALFIGTRLTRSVTGAVAQLYEATGHINRGDFSHRIPVKTNDQLAALANSFNSMASSIEKLIDEQKQKQRLENELTIAQEVQAQLFPRRIAQLDSLEVYGFCRPARTVSGDYYDFVTMNSHQMLLAVGDISGKGISAALLMATVHSAVRAYALEGIPLLREPAGVGAGSGSDGLLAGMHGVEASPAAMLSLLNHQLYESTPAEKYATLFLGFYDGKQRTLFYSNGGHLPPVILGEDRKLRRLEHGGMPVGLFNRMNYEESSARFVPGEILVAYSDGVTEPENDFGEFGEQRLVELVQENRDLPLERISEIVTTAVDDWIGPNEQPDDVTIVLARAR